MPSCESGNRAEPEALLLLSNTGPSGVGMKGEAVGDRGRAEVWKAVFLSDAENQESTTADAVALDIGCVVCKRTALKPTEVVVVVK